MREDREERHPGYWPSAWPVECGGNRRQKATVGRLDADGPPQVTTRSNGLWNVMFVQREPDEWFLQGTTAILNRSSAHGWVERVDPETLEPRATSPELPCGGHVWCGALLAHADGSLYTVNGSYLHRLDPDCAVLAEKELPADRAHNGLLALSDGTLVTKDLRLEGQGASTMTLLSPGTLESVGEPFVLPEASMGRIAADRDSDGDWIYVPGTEHLFRLRWDGERLQLDDTWRPRYRDSGADQGLAWDGCLSGDSVWWMNNGDIDSVRAIFGVMPNGNVAPEEAGRLSWRRDAPWRGPQQLFRAAVDPGSPSQSVELSGELGGAIIAPPVFVPEYGLVVGWDSLKRGLFGLEWEEGKEPRPLWQLDVRPTMQPVVYPDSGEIVINDFVEPRSDELVVVDLESGRLKCRAHTGSPIANGMFLSPGRHRDVFYASTGSIARIAWG